MPCITSTKSLLVSFSSEPWLLFASNNFEYLVQAPKSFFPGESMLETVTLTATTLLISADLERICTAEASAALSYATADTYDSMTQSKGSHRTGCSFHHTC